jgi:VanZ family protein
MDKLVHCFLFFVLCYLLVRGKTKQQGNPSLSTKAILLILSVALLYGIIIELLQHYCTAKRTGDIWDVVADIFGGGIGLWIAYIRTQKRSF